MCNPACLSFGARHLTQEDVQGKRVLEVGSINVNGTLRSTVNALGPREYIGVDIEKGEGVDIVCTAEDIVRTFGKESFDVVITTEMLEHVRDWRRVVSNLKTVCKPGGVILLTTRSFGFRYHGFPYDFWRFELDDMRALFSDCRIETLQKDPTEPGVLLKARKPPHFLEADLACHSLYSIVTDKKMRELRDEDFDNFYFRSLRLGLKIRDLRKKAKLAVSTLWGRMTGTKPPAH